jgi:hypothetical protein
MTIRGQRSAHSLAIAAARHSVQSCAARRSGEADMSFWKKLFGGGGSEQEEPVVHKEIEHKGFTIRATPFKAEGQYQTSGIVSKEVGGVKKEHSFIRADRFTSLDDAIDVSLSKGRQIIDEQGERIFK